MATAAASNPELAPLVTILSREQAIYQQLLAVAEEEREAIVQSRLPELKKVLQRKQDILSKLAHLEDRRVTWLRRYARRHDLNLETVTLAAIIEAADAPEQGLLTRLHRSLRTRIGKVVDANRVTSALLREILDSIDQSLQYLLLDEGAGPTYGARGQLAPAGAAGRQLLEARA